MVRLRSSRTLAVRWMAAGNIHLTLKFLGDTEPAALNSLGDQLERIALNFRPMELVVGGLGSFPNSRQPRVIWVGVEIPAQLTELQRSIEAAAEKIGCPREDRPFSPHLTLGRVQKHASREEISDISRALTAVTVGEIGRFQAEGFTLFRSDLRPGGPIYTPLDHYDFRP